MSKKIYSFINKTKEKNNPFISFCVFIYSISNEWSHSVISVILGALIGSELGKKNGSPILPIILFAVLEGYFYLINGYKKYKNALRRNADIILNEVEALMIGLDDYINSGARNIFEYAAGMVSISMYKVLNEITDCEVRISVIQQSHDEKGRRHCSMISRKSKKRTSCNKKHMPVRYTDKKSYYYLKLLSDNIDTISIFDTKEKIDKIFFWNNNKRKSNIYQYIGIAETIKTDDIAFLLQVDGMEKNTFGKKSKDIEVFEENYIEPYIQFLKHAYNIERVIIGKDENNE